LTRKEGRTIETVMGVKVIFKNENWVLVDKPPEWLTVPGRTGDADPRPCLGKLLEKEVGRRLYPVHRLDFEVSGLVLFALTADAHRRANGWFERHIVRKIYHAYSRGPVEDGFRQRQTWNSRLVRGKKRSFEAPHGLPSITEAVCLEPESAERALWELQPRTGRSHQLRVEMARHGYPIIGDTLYGGVKWDKPGIALRAVKLDFSLIQADQRLGLAEFTQISEI
jgi:tRNA pseudouridine32 synthase/23S rRNA pseudouridine746 synthase